MLGDTFRSDINAAYNQYWAYRTAGDTSNADYIDLNKMFGGLNETSKNANFKYLFATGSIATSLRGTVKVWSEQELINAFGAGLTKKVTDTEVVKEKANIIGANVTVKAKTNIGDVKGETIIRFHPWRAEAAKRRRARRAGCGRASGHHLSQRVSKKI